MFILDKHGDATTRHRTDIWTEWRHQTFPRRFAPLLCRVMSSSTFLLQWLIFDDYGSCFSRKHQKQQTSQIPS